MNHEVKLRHDTGFLTEEVNDKETIAAMKAVPGPFDAVDALGKRIQKRICKSRKNVTPRTELTHHDIVTNMVAKKHCSNASIGGLCCWRQFQF